MTYVSLSVETCSVIVQGEHIIMDLMYYTNLTKTSTGFNDERTVVVEMRHFGY